MARLRPERIVDVPLPRWSANTFSQPACFSASRCKARDWSIVETCPSSGRSWCPRRSWPYRERPDTPTLARTVDPTKTNQRNCDAVGECTVR